MTRWDEYIAYYLRQYQNDPENAYHSLIEAHSAAIPHLMTAFRSAQDPRLRAVLVEAVWRHRRLTTAPFLAEVLDDPDAEVWKSALDGLVTLGVDEGSRAAIEILEHAKRHAESAENHEKRDRIVEAIDQIRG